VRPSRSAWLLLAPFVLLLAVFWLVPLARGFEGSLGQGHYQQILGDKLFAKAGWNTARYLLLSLLAVVPLSLLLALLIQQSARRLRPVMFFLLLLPGLTPPSVLGIVFYEAFHKRGLFNALLGIDPNWLTDPKYIPVAMVMQCVWRWTGFITFFLACGLGALPGDLNEAAELDGATRLERLRHITLPQLRPVLLFCIAYLVIDGVSLFAGAYTLLGESGGTAFAGLLLVTYIYRSGSVALGGTAGAAAAAGLLILPGLAAAVGTVLLGLVRWLRPLVWLLAGAAALTVVASIIGIGHLPGLKNMTGLENIIPAMKPRLAWWWLGLLLVPWLLLRCWAAAPRTTAGIVLPVASLLLTFPVLWMFLASFKDNRQILEPLQLLPNSWSTTYYQQLFSGQHFPFWPHFTNSLIVALGQAVLATLVAAAAGFALARYGGRGRGGWTSLWWRGPVFAAGLLLVMIPRQAIAYPLLEWMQQIHLRDTLLGLILVGGASGIGMLYFTQVFHGIPNSLLETARMEGASELRVFRELLPLIRSALLAYGLIHFVLAWHEHLIPLLLIDTDLKRTLPIALSSLFSSGLSFPKAVIMAACSIIVLPAALLFALTYRALRDAMADLVSGE